jgi:glycosyltransferase involved in cell wall biosynthesis
VRRVLLITYHYPPRPGMGSVRPGGLAKYLPQFGWEPIVLTPRFPYGPRPPARVIETECRDVLGDWKARFRLDVGRGLHEQLRLPLSCVPRTRLLHTKVIDWVKSVITYPDPMKGWLSFAVEAVRELSQNERIDVVWSTAPPITCHLIGQRAKEILKCPWVADFRELWTQNRYYPYGRIRRVVEARLERKTVLAANVLVTLSAPWAELLQAKFGNLPVHWITNGFDPEEFQFEGPELTKAFSITYTGHLYSGKRDPSLLLKVIADLIKEGVLCRNEVVLRFYGPSESWLPALVQRCGLHGVVEIHGIVPRETTLRHQRESQLLLLLSWDDPADAGTYTGKVFEYLGSRRPVLAIGGAPGVEADLLEETKAGVHVRSEAELKVFLIKAYAKFQRLGQLPYDGDERAIERYTHIEMARKFAAILDQISKATVVKG